MTALSSSMPGADGLILLLADGRFPAGGHAHSNGYEAASRRHGLTTGREIEDYLRGRLATAGRTEAGLVAATVHRVGPGSGPEAESGPETGSVPWAELDDEAHARLANRPLRELSRAMGRNWLRAGRRIWPSPVLDDAAGCHPGGPHHVVGFGAVAAVAGLGPLAAAGVHLHHLVSGVTTAAVRLHGIDPYELQAVQVRLVPLVEQVAATAADDAAGPLFELPGFAGPVADLLAHHHANWDTRLFQS